MKNRRYASREDFLYGSEAESALQDFKKGYLVRGDKVALEDSMAGWAKLRIKQVRC